MTEVLSLQGWAGLFANIVALTHASYTVFFLWAIFMSLRGRLYLFRWAQILLTIWILGKIASYLIFENCIFTTTEQYLRKLAGDNSYTVGFIEHYSGLAGLSLSNTAVAWLVITPVVIAIFSEAYWSNRRNS